MRYFRTNFSHTKKQTFFVIDNDLSQVYRADVGIADFIKVACTVNVIGLDLIEVDGYVYDEATQRFLIAKENKE